MPRTPAARFARLTAAALAAVGMLALPLRQVVACPMMASEAEAANVASASVATTTTAAHEHAAHAQHETSPPPHAPSHQTCPDLAHCAAVVLRPLPELLPAPIAITHVVHAPVLLTLRSTVVLPDTPPPKRG